MAACNKDPVPSPTTNAQIIGVEVTDGGYIQAYTMDMAPPNKKTILKSIPLANDIQIKYAERLSDGKLILAGYIYNENTQLYLIFSLVNDQFRIYHAWPYDSIYEIGDMIYKNGELYSVIYVGQDNPVYRKAFYFRNGSAVVLDDRISQLWDINFIGNDLYASGYVVVNGVAKAYSWKNGQPNELYDRQLFKTTLIDNQIVALGRNAGFLGKTYQLTNFTNGKALGSAFSYIGHHVKNNGQEIIADAQGKYLLNDVVKQLPGTGTGGTYGSASYDVQFVGSDYYFVGNTSDGHPAIWKNGETYSIDQTTESKGGIYQKIVK